MKVTKLHEVDGLRTFAVVMDKGDDAAELQRFARAHDVTGAALPAVGAFREATLGYFDPRRRPTATSRWRARPRCSR
jgi:uncharacterized protein